ncbi:MAG: 30S ribosomal protein S6 [Sedimentisphaerales bacterium]
METGVKKLYEVMFLIDSAEAAKDWDGIIELVTKVLNKIDAQIVSLKKWDERPLAYPIKRCSRGTYILAYFKADGLKIHELERDVLLSERIMRALILRVEHLTEEDIIKQATAAVHTPAPVAADNTVAQNEPEAAGTEVADNPEQQV